MHYDLDNKLINFLKETYSFEFSKKIVNIVSPLCYTHKAICYAMADDTQRYYDRCKIISQQSGGIFGIGQTTNYYIEDEFGNVKPVENYIVEGPYFNHSNKVKRITAAKNKAYSTIVKNFEEFKEMIANVEPYKGIPNEIVEEVLEERKIQFFNLDQQFDCSEYRIPFIWFEDLSLKRSIIKFVLERIDLDIDVKKELNNAVRYGWILTKIRKLQKQRLQNKAIRYSRNEDGTFTTYDLFDRIVKIDETDIKDLNKEHSDITEELANGTFPYGKDAVFK